MTRRPKPTKGSRRGDSTTVRAIMRVITGDYRRWVRQEVFGEDKAQSPWAATVKDSQSFQRQYLAEVRRRLRLLGAK